MSSRVFLAQASTLGQMLMAVQGIWQPIVPVLQRMPRVALCALLSIVQLQGCATNQQHRADDAAADAAAAVYVARRGWHIDIGFAVTDLEPPLAAIASDFPRAQSVLL